MLKQLAGCVREYKRPTILTLIFIVGEAVIETNYPLYHRQSGQPD